MPRLTSSSALLEEVEAEVEEGAGDGFAVDGEVFLFEMPSSSSRYEGGEDAVGAEVVLFLALLEVHLFADGIV